MRTLTAATPEEENRKRQHMLDMGYVEGEDFQFSRTYQAQPDKATPGAAGTPTTAVRRHPADLLPDIPEDPRRQPPPIQGGVPGLTFDRAAFPPTQMMTPDTSLAAAGLFNPLDLTADASMEVYRKRVKGEAALGRVRQAQDTATQQRVGLADDIGRFTSELLGLDNDRKRAAREAIRGEAERIRQDEEQENEEILSVLETKLREKQANPSMIEGMVVDADHTLKLAKQALDSDEGRKVKKNLRVVAVGKVLQQAVDEGDAQTIDYMMESWTKGLAGAHLSMRQSLASFGLGDQDALDRDYEDFEAYSAATPQGDHGVLNDAAVGLAGFLGPMVEGTAATAALSLIPGVGVPAALTRLGKVGSTMSLIGKATAVSPYWFAMSQGNTYRSMVKSGVDRDVALAASIPIGLVVGKIEQTQAGQALDVGAKTWLNRKLVQILPTSTLGQRIGTQVIARVGTAAAEAGEETAQSLAQDIGENVSKWVQNEARKDNIELKGGEQVIKDAVDSFVQTFPSMLLMGGVAGGANIAGEFVGDIQFDKAQEQALREGALRTATAASMGAIPSQNTTTQQRLRSLADAAMTSQIDQARADNPEGVEAFELLLDGAMKQGAPVTYTESVEAPAPRPDLMPAGPERVVIASRTQGGKPVGQDRPATVVSQKGNRVTVRYDDGTEQTVDKKRVKETVLPAGPMAPDLQAPSAPDPQVMLGEPEAPGNLIPEGFYPPAPPPMDLGRRATAEARLAQGMAGRVPPEVAPPSRLPGVDYEARAAWEKEYGDISPAVDQLREAWGARGGELRPAAPVVTRKPEPMPTPTPVAAEPAAPAPAPVAEAKPAKRKRRGFPGYTPNETTLLIDEIAARGGMRGRPKGKATAEYDSAPTVAELGGFGRFVFGGNESVDTMAQGLYDDGFLKSPDPEALWAAIRNEVSAYRSNRKRNAEMEAEDKAHKAWVRRGSQEVSVDELREGDRFTIKGESFRVLEEGDKSLTVQDGRTYHIPYENGAVRIDKGSLKQKKRKKAPPMDDFTAFSKGAGKPGAKDERQARQMVARAVESYFGGRIPKGIQVVFDPEWESEADYRSRTIGGRVLHTIRLNAAAVRDARHAKELIDHELGHFAARDKGVREALAALFMGMPADQRTRIERFVNARYEQGTRAEEVSVRGLEEILAQGRNAAAARGALRRLVDRVARLIRRAFGMQTSLDKARRIVEVAARDFLLAESGAGGDAARRGMASKRDTSKKRDAEYLAAVERGDMDAAQRMVDDAAKNAGYTIGPVYHGTATGGGNIKVFSSENLGKQSGNPTAQWGTAFTPNRSYAIGYRDAYSGSNKGLYSAYLKIDTPYEMTFGEMSRGFQDLGDPPWDGKLEALTSKAKTFRVEIEKEGYDGIVVKTRAPRGDFRNHDEIFVFSPNQIKSSDPVVRDENGRVIPLSKRFNQDTPDIRFSKSGLRAGASVPVRSVQDSTLNSLRRAMFQPSAMHARKLADTIGKTDPALRIDLLDLIRQFDRGQDTGVGETFAESVELLKARHVLPMLDLIKSFDPELKANWMDWLRTRGPRGGYAGIPGTVEQRAKRRENLNKMRAALDAMGQELVKRGALEEYDPNYVPRAYDPEAVATKRNDMGQTFVEFIAEKAVEEGKFDDLDEATIYAQNIAENIIQGRHAKDNMNAHDPRRKIAGIAPGEASMLKAREFDFIEDEDLRPWLYASHEYGFPMALIRMINSMEFRRRVLSGKWADIYGRLVKADPVVADQILSIMQGWGGVYGDLKPWMMEAKKKIDFLRGVVTVLTMVPVATKSLAEFGMPMVRAASNNPAMTIKHAVNGFTSAAGALGDKAGEVVFGPKWVSKSEARAIANDIGFFVHGYMQQMMANRDIGDPSIVTWGDKMTGGFYRWVQLENLTRLQRLIATGTAMSFINHAVKVVAQQRGGPGKQARHLEMLQELGKVDAAEAQKLLDFIEGRSQEGRELYAQMVLRFVSETIMDPNRQDRPLVANSKNPFVQAMFQFQGYGMAARQKVAGRIFDQTKKGNFGPLLASAVPVLIAGAVKMALDAATGTGDDDDEEKKIGTQIVEGIMQAGFLGTLGTPYYMWQATANWGKDPLDTVQGAFYSFFNKEIKRATRVIEDPSSAAREYYNALPVVRNYPGLQKKKARKRASSGGRDGGGARRY